jgi:MFS transporter, PPP family, 3-phenylpropionic acid transporter
MPPESQIPTPSRNASRRFASRLGLFYAALFGLLGTHLPFFPVWLRSVGIDASWIGLITAVPAVTRFTTLPFVTASAERYHALRGAMMLAAFATAVGFALVGTQQEGLPIFLAYAATCVLWTPMVPLTDAYALNGVARFGLNYGPLRLWGSASFVIGALACGLLIDVIAARELIWIIVALAVLGAVASLMLHPLDQLGKRVPASSGHGASLRQASFIAIIISAALIQGSHAAYYTFASITWQSEGLGGLTIAALWALGVLAEIVVFALSPRFTLAPAVLLVIGGLTAVVRWVITGMGPSVPLLAVVQLAHGLTYGLTQVATMVLLVRQVPVQLMARAQGYFAACTGIITSTATILSGPLYARYGQEVYFVMAAMAFTGAMLMWLARPLLSPQPHNDASGG